MEAPTTVSLIGAGGHALVCIEVLRSAGFEVAGCVSDDGQASADIGSLGVSMVGTTADLPRLVGSGSRQWFVAIGDNDARRRAAESVTAAGGELVVAVSPHAVVSPSVDIGAGTLVMPGAIVNARAVLGRGVIVNTGAGIDHECSLGDWVHVAPGVALAGRVTVGDGALVGIGASVIPGTRVGAWSVVGAGAAVVDDVPDRATVAGVPARPLRTTSDPSAEPVADPGTDPGTDPAIDPEIDPGMSPTGASATTATTVAEPNGDPAGSPLDADDSVRQDPPKVLIVCTGNLCRSPLVEALLREGLREAGIEAVVTSAGVAAPEGQLPDRKLLRVAEELGVSPAVNVHRSRQLTVGQLDDADLVLAMTAEHLEQIERFFPGYGRATTLRTAAWRSRIMGGRPGGFDEWATRLASELPEGGAIDGADDIADPMGGRLRQYRAMGDEVSDLVRTLVTHWSGR